MNDQERTIENLNELIRQKNITINSLIENSESQTMTNKVLLDKLKQKQTEFDNIKSINLN